MQRAGAGDAARKDLSALRDELLEHLHVFVVDVLELLDAELADALAAIEKLLLAARSARTTLSAGAGGAGRSSTLKCSHVVFSLLALRRLGGSRGRCGRGGRRRGGRRRGHGDGRRLRRSSGCLGV